MRHLAPDNDGINSANAGIGATLGRIIGILARPELSKWRPIMAMAVVLTIVAKLFAVAAPLYFGEAINALGRNEPLVGSVIMGLLFWVSARFLSTGFPYLRDMFFAPVSQDAQRVIAVDAFRHAQHLSLKFHLTRRTGALNRIIERGSNALDFLIRFLAFNIGPTFIELILASVVLATQFGIASAFAAIGTVVAYVIFTLLMTEWRVKQRRRLNEVDTELRARSVDSLTNFETVKAFSAEDREADRFDASFKSYSSTYVETARSLAMLNAGQEFIMNAGLFAIAGVAAWSVATADKLAPGDIAAVVMILMNLYRPLNILGWAWREIKQGSVDLEKLFGLMDMTSDVQDKPDAQAAEGG